VGELQRVQLLHGPNSICSVDGLNY